MNCIYCQRLLRITDIECPGCGAPQFKPMDNNGFIWVDEEISEEDIDLIKKRWYEFYGSGHIIAVVTAPLFPVELKNDL